MGAATDEGLDAHRIVLELRRLARCGLSATKVVEYDPIDALKHLLSEFGGSGTDAWSRANSLVQSVKDACLDLEDEKVQECLSGLYGVPPDLPSFPYGRRMQIACTRWDQGLKVESFWRRQGYDLLGLLLDQMVINRDGAPRSVASLRGALPVEQEISKNKMLEVEARTIIDCDLRRVSATQWRRLVLPWRGGINRFLLHSKDDFPVTLTSEHPNVTSITDLQVNDRNGRRVYALNLSRPTVMGEPFEVGYTKQFRPDASGTQVTSAYLSYASRDAETRESLDLTVSFVGTAPRPCLIIRFIQPTGVLPLLDQAQTTRLTVSEAVPASFGVVKSHYSHGLYWWFDKDDLVPEEYANQFP